MELRIRFTIQLKFIYSICQTFYSWPGCEFRQHWQGNSCLSDVLAYFF